MEFLLLLDHLYETVLWKCDSTVGIRQLHYQNYQFPYIDNKHTRLHTIDNTIDNKHTVLL